MRQPFGVKTRGAVWPIEVNHARKESPEGLFAPVALVAQKERLSDIEIHCHHPILLLCA
jgi:hypothetical protein